MANADGPYGITIFSIGPSNRLLPQAITNMQTLGVTWLRYQQRWSAIENPQGTYNWSGLDDAVSRCNTAGINIAFALQDPPFWGLSATPCSPGYYLPSASAMATFAMQVASRYNGSSDYGHLDAIEIGNEEFDSLPAISCRDGAGYAPVVLACVPAIRNAGFTGKIGAAGMLGQNAPHIKTFLNNLYTAGTGTLVDYLTFHYYRGDAASPAISNIDYRSFDSVWYNMYLACIANNDADKAIWFTEVGYPTSTVVAPASAVVTAANQATYLKYELDSARQSNIVKKIFIYTMDSIDVSGNLDSKSITQGLSPNIEYLPAFYMLKDYITTYPFW